jgi:Lar family restriction alleviation protein
MPLVMEELKRCPFCGGEAIELRASESYWVRCSDCDAEIALCDSRFNAIAAWNRRVEG